MSIWKSPRCEIYSSEYGFFSSTLSKLLYLSGDILSTSVEVPSSFLYCETKGTETVTPPLYEDVLASVDLSFFESFKFWEIDSTSFMSLFSHDTSLNLSY